MIWVNSWWLLIFIFGLCFLSYNLMFPITNDNWMLLACLAFKVENSLFKILRLKNFWLEIKFFKLMIKTCWPFAPASTNVVDVWLQSVFWHRRCIDEVDIWDPSGNVSMWSFLFAFWNIFPISITKISTSLIHRLHQNIDHIKKVNVLY